MEAGNAKREKRANEPGEIGQAVAKNLQSVRDMSTREMSERLQDLGRPILATGITKIEAGQRRVDADDLVALAVALRVNPNRLLLPVDNPHNDVALTPVATVSQWEAWAWARGRLPLAANHPELGEPGMSPELAIDDFRRRTMPADERIREDHTAVRAARTVLDRLQATLDPGNLLPDKTERNAGPLRRALAILSAEVDDLLGADDGEH